MSTPGVADGEPVKVATPVADMVTAYMATIAILAAHRAAATQQPRRIPRHQPVQRNADAQQIGYASYFASDTAPPRRAAPPPNAAPNEAYQTLMAGSWWPPTHPKRYNRSLVRRIGRRELEHDPRFSVTESASRTATPCAERTTPLFRQRAPRMG